MVRIGIGTDYFSGVEDSLFMVVQVGGHNSVNFSGMDLIGLDDFRIRYRND